MRTFGGRLGVDATVYQTNTRNQLFTVALPVGSGASSFFTNGGDVENRGVELTVSGTPIQTMDVSWDIDVNFSANRNTVKRISDERPSLTIAEDFLRAFRIEEGEPFGQVYSRGFERDDGRVVVNSDGMPQLTDGKTVPVANFNPDWLGSIRSSFSYKNVSVGFLIDHRQGGSISSLTNAILYEGGLTTQTLEGRDGSLVFGDNFFSDETAVVQVGTDSDGDPIYEPNTTEIDAETFWTGVGGRNAPAGEAFTEDATNTRLRELTLGYRLPQSVINRLPVSSLRFSLVGRNLFFIHRASNNLDPDLMVGTGASAEGFESFTPPTTRSFGANLRIDY